MARWVLLFLLLASPAFAGAWTQKEDQGHMITSVTMSRASRSFDGKADPSIPISYSKLLTQTHIEYGLRDWVTLFLDPEYARAKSGVPGGTTELASAMSIGGGLRLRLLDGANVVSIEGSYKSAGAFNTSVSVNQEAGRQFELRGIYGRSFPVLGLKGFAEIGIAQRFIAGARPSETPVDLTLGLHLWDGTMVMAQSFNVIAGGNARRPYSYYRTHKFQLSVVQHVWRDLTIQLGGFISPAGQNALKEQGLSIAVWQPFSL